MKGKIKEPKVTEELALAHGLSEDEYEQILQILGRKPTFTELGIFSVMWSEHCCYKSSKVVLAKLPTRGKHILQGPGENAGIVDIGDRQAIAFKIESHNHPSAIEPYQGAATGIGGILRDIFTVGARPIALLDPLRFGNPAIARNRHIIHGVISGIADYGNCVGVPNAGGDIYFADSFNGNPLINVMCVGLVEKRHITLASAKSKGGQVVYFGNATGRDGIHGATFASEELGEDSQEKRPAVQVGDPFMGKKILEATLELIESGVVEAIQDMGAAGLTCSSCEMAGRGGKGVRIDLDRVPQRAENLTPYELMLSESQERMLAIVPKSKLDKAREILERWEVGCHVLGEITEDGIMRVVHGGKAVAEIPARKISDDSPCYVRQSRVPKYIKRIPQFSEKKFPPPKNYGRTMLGLLGKPTIASKRWVYEQYDHMVQTSTVVPPGHSSGVLRIKGTNKHIALTSDCNGLFCYLAPRMGASIAVAEAARNLVCAGARPLAITNCLNFGNPEKPEIFYQFEKCVEGMSEACRKLDTPVTGGNVSFYNEYRGVAVFPTPVIGMLGLIEKPEYITTVGFKDEGDVIVLSGADAGHLGGSQYFYALRKKIVGPCPRLDLDYEKRLQRFVMRAIRLGVVKSAQDLSEGGLAVALAESCILSGQGLGARVQLPGRKRPDIEIFSEAQSRILLSCKEEYYPRLSQIAKKHNVRIKKIGVVGGSNLRIGSLINLSVSRLRGVYYKEL